MAGRVDKSKLPCNKPKRQSHGSGPSGKSHIVKACKDGKEKIIRFGQQGVKGSPKKEGESEAYRKRREAFKARHAENIKKGKIKADDVKGAYYSLLGKKAIIAQSIYGWGTPNNKRC